MHFPSLYSVLLTVSNTHVMEGKRGSEGSQSNPPFSLITVPVIVTRLLPASPEERK